MAYGVDYLPDPPDEPEGYWDADHDSEGNWYRVWVPYEDEEE